MQTQTPDPGTATGSMPAPSTDVCTCDPICNCDAGLPTTRAEMLASCHNYITKNEQKLPLLLADKRKRRIAKGIRRNIQISRMYIAREQLTDAMRAETNTLLTYRSNNGK